MGLGSDARLNENPATALRTTVLRYAKNPAAALRTVVLRYAAA